MTDFLLVTVFIFGVSILLLFFLAVRMAKQIEGMGNLLSTVIKNIGMEILELRQDTDLKIQDINNAIDNPPDWTSNPPSWREQDKEEAKKRKEIDDD